MIEFEDNWLFPLARMTSGIVIAFRQRDVRLCARPLIEGSTLAACATADNGGVQ
jgi:hypothetical protein